MIWFALTRRVLHWIDADISVGVVGNCPAAPWKTSVSVSDDPKRVPRNTWIVTPTGLMMPPSGDDEETSED